ncbi:TIMELESS-interacting protein-like [Salvia splendens]|uniref:TIMELESS-interacting protein-like n=1 Tax=Salvia splendens TaxID=180675 RepID=UPI001C27044D|nr:TIMELESS-interacting protein-like [Salvia splendens]
MDCYKYKHHRHRGRMSGGAVPTGCYKCGRPGHWSRDCPSDPNTSETNNNGNQRSDLDPSSKSASRPPLAPQKLKQKPPRKVRPKLTPDLLLSDAGIGHILRYFPPALKCRGRGHEVDDLRHLLRMYADWHSRLLPYYNFEQFLDKVERVGSSKRVKVCLRDLRDKVSNGVDPTKLQEDPVQQDSVDEQDTSGHDMPCDTQENNNMQTGDDNDFQEDMPQSIWEEATQEPSQPVVADTSRAEEVQNQTVEANPSTSNSTYVMTEEQKARMEANRLRALERAAARALSKQA